MKKTLALLILTALTAKAQVTLSPAFPSVLTATISPEQTQLALANLSSVVQLPTNTATAQIQSISAVRKPDGSTVVIVRLKPVPVLPATNSTNTP
jgi:hypothetical protein